MARQLRQPQPARNRRARRKVSRGTSPEPTQPPSPGVGAEDLVRLETLLREVRAENTRLARLAAFPEQNANPVVEADFDGRIRYSNPSALR